MKPDIRWKIRNYFTGLSKNSIILIVVGAVLMLAALAGGRHLPEDYRFIGDIVNWAGIALAIAGAGVVIYHFAVMPKDEVFDGCFEDDLKEIRSMALAKLGMDELEETGKFILLWGPPNKLLEQAEGADFRGGKFKKGADGKYRFSEYLMALLAPGEKKLGILVCRYDIISDVIYDSETAEYLYKDMVSMHTHEGRDLSLTFTDGQSIKMCAVPESQGETVFACPSIPFISSQEATRAIRKLMEKRRPE